MSKQANTFLFADLAGYAALTEAHGDEDAAELAADFFGCVRQLGPEYGGEEVKTIGDAILLRCDKAAAAVELGLRLVEDVGERPRFPLIRVGMHTGSAIERDGDWFGAAVNLAARVSGLAAGREVLLTEATRDAAGQPRGIEFRHRGVQRFKHISQLVDVYRATRAGERAEGLPIDPVCRMAVDPGQGAGVLTYEGVEYHFCSLDCACAFAATPEAYVALD
jgi:class 3 adenylate cyclase/YHS domain-containing protein